MIIFSEASKKIKNTQKHTWPSSSIDLTEVMTQGTES